MLVAAFLRGVNVGGNKKLSMDSLRATITEIGFTRVQTLLQSGNLVFEAGERTPKDLEGYLAEQVELKLELATEFFVRTPEEIASIVANNPFTEEAIQDPGHLLVLFLSAEPDPKDIDLLQSSIVGREVLQVVGREVYVVFPDGIGDSKLNSQLNRRLGKSWTGRNWNTVTKLSAMLQN